MSSVFFSGDFMSVDSDLNSLFVIFDRSTGGLYSYNVLFLSLLRVGHPVCISFSSSDY